MSQVEMLRAFVKQRLTAAAEEIFEQFERTIAEYEEELKSSSKEIDRQQKLLDAVRNPEVGLHRADVPQLLVVKDSCPPEQQEWSSRPDQEGPEPPPHIKEEQEELWTSQEGEQLRGPEEADAKFPFASVTVKSEEDSQRSQLHENETEATREAEHSKTEADGEDCGGPEPAGNSDPERHPEPDAHDDSPRSSEPENDDSRDWEETGAPQSGSNPLQNIKVLAIDVTKGKTKFSCSICRKRFTWKNSLVAHMKRHSEGKCFSCSVCKTMFSNNNLLLKHMTVHTGEKPFGCPVCRKRFADRSNLKRHLILHTGERPFQCPVCSKRFAQKAHLEQHAALHTREKHFTCSVCSKRFSNHSNLRRHLALHTGEKPFSCPVCGKTFAQRGHLKQHLPVHTREKPFSCSVCSKTFTQKHHVTQHLAVHTGDKPFSCPVCSKTFTKKQYLEKHKCVGESSRKK
ncbi:zinc finger and SCAN domain-containing protein 12-like [Perca fluviatilis]|uniref:zinc finger and SCAN domain-containing protein 12-like n=1 Tax=Perca fluviatilis TaxID=8168 RepID=UPI00196300AD|nr:zinc finger and SCAN domain-containing protein 12-like [Perca fluviatilis]